MRLRALRINLSSVPPVYHGNVADKICACVAAQHRLSYRPMYSPLVEVAGTDGELTWPVYLADEIVRAEVRR